MAAHRRPARTRRLAGYAANVGLVVVTLLAVAYVVPSLLGHERYVITGGSMAGTHDKGSIVFERATAADELEVGDVITYQPPASSGVTTLVTHRIIAIGQDDNGRQVLRTQGDANPDPDPWRFSLTSEEQPVVAYSVPYAGWALIALADRETRMLIVGIPAALIALLSLGQLAGALRSRPDPHLGGRIGTAGSS
ncbi:S26 family signal peptidase [Nocardioides sp. Root190]|uniref:signal peptidase I n=1 Tax=Nocardioides sp. Root190 TaxID=1736488 RepID=UPI0006F4F5B1|nr:signal peptidase I [Nocardioides sp. Root190]KRB78333.1 S26 family signal peptidase [Nocardioides sp. Root190]